MSDEAETGLARKLNLPLMIFYGVGTMLGAGIYVLVGKVAGAAGMHLPLAFVGSAVVATFSALSYAEMASRFPSAGGEATYVDEVFGKRWFTAAVGWSIVATGVVSSATMAEGFVGYLDTFFELPAPIVILLFSAVLVTIAAWGVAESVTAAVFVTALEVAGVGLVVALAGDAWATFPEHAGEILLPTSPAAWAGIGSGAFLAFYAYVGFEDMVNMAEEVRDPGKVLPRAIVIALVVTTLIYAVAGITATLALPTDVLDASTAPFADIVKAHSEFPTSVISLISLFAVGNGALVQVIMASRVVYGLARRDGAPAYFGAVHPKTRTPVRSTVFAGVLVLVLALALPLEALARVTASIILVVFCAVNVALLKLKWTQDDDDYDGVRYPLFVPVLGVVTCVGFLVLQLTELVG